MRCIPFTNLAIFALILCLFASCRRDDITLELSDQPLLINNAAKMLKGSTMNSSWSADESFGLFLKPTGSAGFTELLELNRKYMYNANLSVFQLIGNPIYYPLSGNVDLIAYTPFKEDLTTI